MWVTRRRLRSLFTFHSCGMKLLSPCLPTSCYLIDSCQTTYQTTLGEVMPRKTNPLCQACAGQSIDAAKEKPCWVDKTCRARRSYYKHRAANLSKKRTRQRAAKHKEASADMGLGRRAEVVDYPIVGHREPAEATMVFYRNRADSRIHALEFCITEQGKLVKRVKAKHLKSVTQTELRQHIKQVIALLKVEFSEDLIIREARQPVSLCPICMSEEGSRDE